MKFVFLLSLASIIIFGCAKKNVPVATVTAPLTPVVVAPDAAKIDVASDTLSTNKMVAIGQEIFTAKCGRCHGLKKVDDYSVTQWVPIMERMAVKARLDSTEKANVIAYVQIHSKAG